MKFSGALYYLAQDEYPFLGNTTTTKVRVSPNGDVSGELHFFAVPKDALVKELRYFADKLEALQPTPK